MVIDPASTFEWRDHSRFVRVSRVATGWLVIWGRYFDLGQTTEIEGTRLYASQRGLAERVGAAAAEVTGRGALAAEATTSFSIWSAHHPG